MLDTATRKRIDDCRDILVGKLPDPKAQIEQITIGLIYKFMDDMDKEAIELGGKAKFFQDYKVPDPEFPSDRKKDKVVPFAQHAWDRLLDPKVSATDMLRLYSEAIIGMDKNPNIPQLFRDIFKNAYLPYRDPETLKLFLKTIGEFQYTHSEKLGDAFEYLLSVMGSQGDAGQFRTPRHIIDFLVALVNPTKEDSILDPACGTAGFLISAFKHIKEQNQSGLTPDESKKLIRNFVGYDISPDMVRLSLVNLYLHGFSDPHIYEYDTLSSEDRWNESFDVILANPPFMSPKGGIRPHKKFSIDSNRSEVLFVDYIAEHLAPNGRAGIIVPEGIIFQSGTAYKELRKMLVENYLYAVVSLPAGVFNPYSGVKTSILLLNKEINKNLNQILFVKIDNDGYSLGAQRSAVKGSQLKEAVELTHTFIQTGEHNESFIAHAVDKTEIVRNVDHSLSGERYKMRTLATSNFPIVKLGEVAVVIMGQAPLGEDTNKDGIGTPFVKVGNFDVQFPRIEEWTTNPLKMANSMDTLVCVVGATIGKINKGIACAIGRSVAAIRPLTDKIDHYYLYYTLKEWTERLRNSAQGSAIGVITKDMLNEIAIALPNLSIQQQIAAEIEAYQKIIDGAKVTLENYKPKIDIDIEWEIVELGQVCEINPKKSELKDIQETMEVSFVPMADLNENQIDFLPKQKKLLGEVYKGYTYFKNDDVLLAKVTPCFENGKAGVAKGLTNGIGFGSSEFFVIRPNSRILPTWIYLNVITGHFREKGKLNMTGTGGLQRVPLDYLKSTLIPLPTIDEQLRIVTKIEKELDLINSNKQLIQIFEQKIKERIAKVWGK